MRTWSSLLLLLTLASVARAQDPFAAEAAAFNAGQPKRGLEITTERIRTMGTPAHTTLAVLTYATFTDNPIQRDSTVLAAVANARAYLANNAAGVEPRRAALRAIAMLAAYEATYGTVAQARTTLRKLRMLPGAESDGVVHRTIQAIDLVISTRAGTVTESKITPVAEFFPELKSVNDAGMVALVLARAQLKMKDYKSAIATALSVKSEHYQVPRLLTAARASRAAGDSKAAAQYYKQALAARASAEPTLKAWRKKIELEAAE